jgi:hypothetical protein
MVRLTFFLAACALIPASACSGTNESPISRPSTLRASPHRLDWAEACPAIGRAQDRYINVLLTTYENCEAFGVEVDEILEAGKSTDWGSLQRLSTALSNLGDLTFMAGEHPKDPNTPELLDARDELVDSVVAVHRECKKHGHPIV